MREGRALSRQREMLTRGQTQHVQHMQKVLSQMNVQLDNVIAEVNGVTGQRIIRAILAGERDPVQLAQMKHARIRADEATIAKALVGTWREEHLFARKQAVELYDAYQARLEGCDAELVRALTTLAVHDALEAAPAKPRRGGRPRRAAFDLRESLYRACGVDLTAIDGIDTGTALKVLAEVGPDLSRFKSAKHFASWLGLSPGTKISGGKVLSGASKRSSNRLAQALRMAATSLRHSRSALGAYYRRLCGRLDKAKAIRATAHKLARLIYALLTRGQAYVDHGQDY